MRGYLTTHVLDTARGVPAAGVTIDLYRLPGTAPQHLARVTTNADGRTDAPILDADEFAAGTYELVFDAGSYLRGEGAPDSFLGLVPVRFTMSQPLHYHVPLLLSPFGYSTYRGS